MGLITVPFIITTERLAKHTLPLAHVRLIRHLH